MSETSKIASQNASQIILYADKCDVAKANIVQFIKSVL